MNASSNSTASAPSTDLERGYSVVYRAIDLLGWGIAVATAWACSSLVLGTIMFIVTGVVMALLAYASKLFVMLSVEPTKIETVGRVINPSRITSLFKRTTPAATN